MKKIDKKFLLSILYSLVIPALLYFVLKLFQSNYHTIYSAIDNKIPFIPQFIYMYILFFPFIVFILYLVYIKNKAKYYNGLNALVLGLIVTEIIFLVYPTIIYRPDISNNIDIVTRTVISVVYFFDTPAINCFPSIHILLCLQVSYMSLTCKSIKYKPAILVISVLIMASTLLVKQHYFYDIIGAFIIFSLSNIIIKYHKIR